jgi:hypothetical protein
LRRIFVSLPVATTMPYTSLAKEKVRTQSDIGVRPLSRLIVAPSLEQIGSRKDHILVGAVIPAGADPQLGCVQKERLRSCAMRNQV